MRRTAPPALPIAALSLALVLLAGQGRAQTTDTPPADPQRGKVVFRTVGGCVNCHGWAGDGQTGVNMRAPSGPSLRATALDTAALTEVIRCGRPGTPMPYHDRAAYRDDRCYGQVMSDFAPGDKPARGKSLTEDDIAALVSYLQSRVIGLGKPTHAECVDFFDNPAAKACNTVK